MDKKIIFFIIASILILIFWLSFITFLFYSKIAKEEKAPAPQYRTTVSPIFPEVYKSVFGKYSADDFDYFEGVFLSKNKEDYIIVVSGYLKLKREIIEKEGVPPLLPMEVKYIVIDKNTEISRDDGKNLTIDDLSPEDLLKIKSLSNADYNSPYFLASKITVTKKVWPKGENPFE